jgi:threonine/homoserine/homoserine lactone efflux protein
MILFLVFLLGIISAFIGLIPPSMLNMTAVKISTTKGRRKAEVYAVGVSITVFFQATAALLITKILKDNQEYLIYVKEVAAVIFIILSVYFFRKGFSERKENYTPKQRIKNNFTIGLLLSFLNMFAIPYYCGIGAALDIAGYLDFSKLSILSFVMGATIGTFLILFLYIFTAQKISHKIQLMTKNINFILAIITGALGIITLVNLSW